jgi:hypothetical protein
LTNRGRVRFVESTDKPAQARRRWRRLPRQQKAQPVSYFVTDCLVVLWLKVHGSHSQALGLQHQTLDSRFLALHEVHGWLAISAWLLSHAEGEQSQARVPQPVRTEPPIPGDFVG